MPQALQIAQAPEKSYYFGGPIWEACVSKDSFLGIMTVVRLVAGLVVIGLSGWSGECSSLVVGLVVGLVI